MEHRYDRRVNNKNILHIHMSNGVVATGVMQNVSYGGLALNTPIARYLNKNEIVKADFKLYGEHIMLNSQVVRVNGELVALMFIEQPSSLKKLLDIEFKRVAGA